MASFSVLEICAGAGGQAFGLEQAGFSHRAAIEIDKAACETLRRNRPNWDIREADVRGVDPKEFVGIDLLAGGVPCPPFSIAGRQLGRDDDRDLFPVAIDFVRSIRPKAVLLENVPGLATAKFKSYRQWIRDELASLGYRPFWKVLQAQDYGVPQLRPRFVLVALEMGFAEHFAWPEARSSQITVGEALQDLMGANGWLGASKWAERARAIAPTIVGGSKLHGGPDLGPTRSKKAWALLGVNGHGVADSAPSADFPLGGDPKLTVRMCARLQGFPDSWIIEGRKTAAYRQVGNAFPPPVAKAVGIAIREALQLQPRVSDDLRLPLVATA